MPSTPLSMSPSAPTISPPSAGTSTAGGNRSAVKRSCDA